MNVRDIRWGRVLLGGLFIELSMFAVVVPLNAISPRAAYYSVPLLAFATALLFGWWAAKPVSSRFVLHGTLVAIAASAMYIALTTAMGADVPWLYHLSHLLRLAGGAAGGTLAERAIREASRVVPDRG
jgi:hypothetical protein